MQHFMPCLQQSNIIEVTQYSGQWHPPLCCFAYKNFAIREIGNYRRYCACVPSLLDDHGPSTDEPLQKEKGLKERLAQRQPSLNRLFPGETHSNSRIGSAQVNAHDEIVRSGVVCGLCCAVCDDPSAVCG